MPESCLSQDFSMLFENKTFLDVILSVSGRELHAHKAILAARSPVFAAMFTHDMKEKRNNYMEITKN
jgi:speckle-type POZ protein